jgi:uncharacterized protein YwgA
LAMEIPEPLKLLSILSKYSAIKGKIELHKLIYTLQTQKGLHLGYRFINYSFGPYSKELEEDLRLLASLGLIKEEKGSDGTIIKLSEKGESVLKNLNPLTQRQPRVRV